MPRRACEICGSPALKGNRCTRHPRRKPPARPYRGTSAYRAFRAQILERDAGICHRCGQAGANELGHTGTPYSQQDPSTRDDVSQWDPADFAAEHRQCNASAGATQ